MKKSTVITAVAGAVVVIALIVAYRLLGPLIGAKVEEQVAKIGLTPNQVAAHGPLPGDVSLYAKELACQRKIPTPGYYSSINGAELADGNAVASIRVQRSRARSTAPIKLCLAQPGRLSWDIVHQQPRAGELYLMGRFAPD